MNAQNIEDAQKQSPHRRGLDGESLATARLAALSWVPRARLAAPRGGLAANVGTSFRNGGAEGHGGEESDQSHELGVGVELHGGGDVV